MWGKTQHNNKKKDKKKENVKTQTYAKQISWYLVGQKKSSRKKNRNILLVNFVYFDDDDDDDDDDDNNNNNNNILQYVMQTINTTNKYPRKIFILLSFNECIYYTLQK